MKEVYIVSEIYSINKDVIFDLSCAYDTIEDAQDHLRRVVAKAKHAIERESHPADNTWTFYEDELPNFWRAELDEDNYHNIEFHRKDVVHRLKTQVSYRFLHFP